MKYVELKLLEWHGEVPLGHCVTSTYLGRVLYRTRTWHIILYHLESQAVKRVQEINVVEMGMLR